MTNELLNTIIKALIVLESKCDPDKVDGDKVGVLGITPEIMDEVNRIQGKTRLNLYGLVHREKPRHAVDMARIYLRHNMQDISNRHPDIFCVEYAARIWTAGPTGQKWISGPNGYKEDVAIAYSHKAKQIFHIIQALERIEKLGIFEKGK